MSKQIKVLDKGFVRLVDTMGNDSAIVQAARVSYGAGTKSVNADKGLIRYLMRNRHTSPFEMCEIKLHIKAPLVVLRQWLRHRTANVNECSGRYSEMLDEFYIPELSRIQKQSKDNKQGSAEPFDVETATHIQRMIAGEQETIRDTYEGFLDSGLARELARINLPLSQYTECYWKIDLHNLLHFLMLRLDNHAQYEIRVYAEAIADIVKEWCPITFQAFEDYIVNSKNVSSLVQDILRWLAFTVFPTYAVDEFTVDVTKWVEMYEDEKNIEINKTEKVEIVKLLEDIYGEV